MELDKKLKQLPIIDWEMGTKLAGGKRETANEILGMLKETLPNTLAEIQDSYAKGRLDELTQRVHKLHGAVCYCGTPRLKIVLNHIETELKNNIMDDLPLLVEKLSFEVDCLLDHQ